MSSLITPKIILYSVFEMVCELSMVYDSCMIVKFTDLAAIRARHSDKKIVLTTGTFDLFHIGHVRYLQSVKSYGDIVVVMLSGDARVKARKGSERPVYPERDRAEILDELKATDYVFIDPGDNKRGHIDPVYADILASLQPDLYVTDGEDDRFSKNLIGRTKLVILPRAEGGKHASTTAIIEHIAGIIKD